MGLRHAIPFPTLLVDNERHAEPGETMKSNAENLFETMAASLTRKLEFAIGLTGSLTAAIEKVKRETTAGPKVWETVLAQFAGR